MPKVTVTNFSNCTIGEHDTMYNRWNMTIHPIVELYYLTPVLDVQKFSSPGYLLGGPTELQISIDMTVIVLTASSTLVPKPTALNSIPPRSQEHEQYQQLKS